MSKQEEIREGRSKITNKWRNYWQGQWSTDMSMSHFTLESEILNYLHSQGVVIKVEREITESPTQLEMDIHQPLIKYLNDKANLFEVTEEINEIYNKAGYVAVEPLIDNKCPLGETSSDDRTSTSRR